MNMSVQSRTFPCSYGHIVALEWNSDSSSERKIIAVHGWLDNAASFSVLAPLIDAHIVAIDTAGHGKTSHRHLDAEYNLWQDIYDVIDVADQLGWQQFELLGHSRGAAITSMTAGAMPERVSRLYLIDGGLAKANNADEMPERIATIIESRYNYGKTKPSGFPTREMAIKARANNDIPIPYAAAELLAERSLEINKEGQFYWNADQRLKMPSVYLTVEQVQGFIKRITMPVQVFVADNGLSKIYPIMIDKLSSFNNATLHHLPGSHHLHMEASATEIAEIINRGQ